MNRFDRPRYAGIQTYDINNGTGFGVTLFVQGCSHQCYGCHNPETWSRSGGMQFTPDVFKSLWTVLADDNIVRLTVSGGEPFENLDWVYPLCALFKQMWPTKELWIYTGYTYEVLVRIGAAERLLKLADVLVDGLFSMQDKDLSLAFRGSRNQRIIDVQESLRLGFPTCIGLDGVPVVSPVNHGG